MRFAAWCAALPVTVERTVPGATPSKETRSKPCALAFDGANVINASTAGAKIAEVKDG